MRSTTRGRRSLVVLGAGLVAAASAATARGEEVSWRDATLPVGGRLLGASVDDGDGRRELVLAVLSRTTGRRELRMHEVGPDGIAHEPRRVVPVLEDVTAWGWADVRDEPGRELVFLTASGAWSYSTVHAGYRDNVARLVEAEILYDVADPTTLPQWRYVLPGGPRNALLLPGPAGYTVWEPDGEADGPYRAGATFLVPQNARPFTGAPPDALRDDDGLDVEARMSGSGATIRLGDGNALVSARTRLRAPALVDVDGDGRLDLVRRDSGSLHVHLEDGGSVPRQPSRSEAFPSFLAAGDGDIELSLHDLDADGDIDVVARREDEDEGPLATNSTFTFFVLINRDGRLLPDEPDQVLRFLATTVRVASADVDGDEVPDLVVHKVLAPSLLEITSPEGLRFTRSVLVFLGGARGTPFSRKPDLKHEDSYDETTLAAALTNRRLTHDCDGDGIADVVDVGLDGRVTIHRVRRESGFFGGETWELDRTPWRGFDVGATFRETMVEDLNGDGLGDVISPRQDRVVVLLSDRGTTR